MNLNPFPEWAQHDRRLQHGLRAFCDNVATLVTAGHISPEQAGALSASACRSKTNAASCARRFWCGSCAPSRRSSSSWRRRCAPEPRPPAGRRRAAPGPDRSRRHGAGPHQTPRAAARNHLINAPPHPRQPQSDRRCPLWVMEHLVPVGHLFSGEIEMPKPQALELLDRLVDAMDQLRKEVLECPAQ